MTQVFPHGGAEIMHPEKGTFKVNTQRLKPYFGGGGGGARVSCEQASHSSEHIRNSAVGSRAVP